jgi:glycosyltransferase involved in cell wall biosynthesis
MIALADVCLLTSMREGLPRVLVQYMAAGKPCVVSRLPGLEDVVQDGVSAVITEGGDVAAAARAAARLLADPLERARLAAGASGVDVDAWSPEIVSARISEAYAAAAHESRPL